MLDRAYEAEDLLSVFFRKLLRLALPAKGIQAVTKCVFSLEEITEESVAFLHEFAEKLGFRREQVQIQDHRESFYAYVVSQEPSLWKQQVLLFEERGNGVFCRALSCNRKTRPMIVEVGEAFLGKLPEDDAQKDKEFAEMVKQVLTGRIVTAVYLIGSGFEGVIAAHLPQPQGISGKEPLYEGCVLCRDAEGAWGRCTDRVFLRL